MSCWHSCHIGFGANLGKRRQTFRAAQRLLENNSRIKHLRSSSCYFSAAVGAGASGCFLNAVLKVCTNLSAQEVLSELMEIEARLGRTRLPGNRNASRTIDLDLLLYADQIIDSTELQVPHPRMKQRLFVLSPLLELSPYVRIPATTETSCSVLSIIASGQFEGQKVFRQRSV